MAAEPDNHRLVLLAQALYEDVVRTLRESGVRVETGVFQAAMLVHIDNDGPVTFVLDTDRLGKS